MENKDCMDKLNAYTKELDELASLMERAGFPFEDAAMIYAEVSTRIKTILSGAA